MQDNKCDTILNEISQIKTDNFNITIIADVGCVLNADYAGQAKQISQEAAKAGVMVLIAGGNVVRFAPALNVSEEEVTTGLDRFAAACEHFVSRGSS